VEREGIDWNRTIVEYFIKSVSTFCAISNRLRLPRDWQQFPETCHLKEIAQCKQSLLFPFISVRIRHLHISIPDNTAHFQHYRQSLQDNLAPKQNTS
jgi:hypothetical protein